MIRRVLYPWGVWLVGALGVPVALVALGLVLLVATDIGELPFDDLGLWWLVLAAPVAGVLCLYGAARRRRALGRFTSVSLGPLLVPWASPTRQVVRATAVIVSVFFIAVAITGPRWGVYLEKQEAYGVDVVVALDVSRSMLARDVAPNRLLAAKRDIRRHLTERSAFQRMHRLGLLAFAGSATLRMPLSTDHLAFRAKLADVGLGSAPRGGTAIAEAIKKATLLLASSPDDATRLILLLTDGEDHEGDPVAAAQTAFQAHGIRTYTIGVGDPALPAGAEVPMDGRPGSKPLLYDGQIVFSKLDVDGLRTIAEAGGGRYASIADLGHLVDAISSMHRTRLGTEARQIHRPRYQWFLAAALVCVLMEPLIRPSRRSVADLPRRVWQQEAAA
ncbi:MAG: VWA domain-containing protein [Phycisphaerae bacterium]